MHSSHVFLFLLLGLTVSCSAQLADLTAQLAEDPSAATPQIGSTNNAEIAFGINSDSGLGAGAPNSGSDSPEAFTMSQTDDNQRCLLRNPKEGSDTSGNLNRPNAEWNKPGTRGGPELPYIPGKTKERDSDPCKDERTFPVCSPLELTKTWFPLSLLWTTGSLEYCRLCTFLSPIHLRLSKGLDRIHFI